MKKQAKRIGLAIVGAGRVGLIRGELAARHPQVDWIGLAEKNPARAKFVADTIGADFVTAGDWSCLMNIDGAQSRQGAPVRSVHLAEILASTREEPWQPPAAARRTTSTTGGRAR